VRLDYLLGEGQYRRATVFSHVRRLENTIVFRDKVWVEPTQSQPKKKLQRYSHVPGMTSEQRDIIDTKNKLLAEYHEEKVKEHIFSRGRYEAHLSLSSHLSTNFIGKLKHEVAEFFGFSSWNEGLILTKHDLPSIYLNARNGLIHSHGLKRVAQEPYPIGDTGAEKQERTAETNTRGGVGSRTTSEPDLDNYISSEFLGELNHKTRRLIQKASSRRAHLSPREGSSKTSVPCGAGNVTSPREKESD